MENRIFSKAWHKRYAALVLAAGLLPAAAGAATLRLDSVLMTGLVNPRGLTVGLDGALYVAEAGAGGPGGSIVGGSGATLTFGLTSGVTRYQNGVQQRIFSGLPSLSGPEGADATGVQDLVFDDAGRLFGIIGLGADPAQRALLAGEAGSQLLGTLVALDPEGVTLISDVAAYEALYDPDGNGPDSNPFGLVASAGGFVVTDAGGNDVLVIDGSGTITGATVVPPASNPLPFGPPTYESVPTGAALGPGGELIFGQLTGFPFPPGGADVFGLSAGALSVLAGGFTNLIDVAVGADGTIFALEFDSDSLIGPGATGALYSIDGSGARTLLFGGLLSPTGLALGSRGDFFVSTNGLSATEGRVIHLSPVPLPAALPALAGALATLAAWRVRSGRRPSRLLD